MDHVEHSPTDDACPPPLRRLLPTVPAHVEPFPEGLASLRFRTEPEYVSIGILRLHFARPVEVGRRLADPDTVSSEFLEKSVDVTDADPDPTPRMALVAFCQEDPAASPGHGGKATRSLPIQDKPEYTDVVRC